jgi:hypothetical protein
MGNRLALDLSRADTSESRIEALVAHQEVGGREWVEVGDETHA